MYRCLICGEVAPPNTPATRIVLAVRPITYPYRSFAHHRKRRGIHRWIPDPGGTGYEIAKEVTACPSCADLYHDRPPVILRE